MLDGKQYLIVGAGDTLYALYGGGKSELGELMRRGTVWIGAAP